MAHLLLSCLNIAPRSVPTPRRESSLVPLLLLLLLPLPRFTHRVSPTPHRPAALLTPWASSTSLVRHARLRWVGASRSHTQNGRGTASMPVSLVGGTRVGERML